MYTISRNYELTIDELNKVSRVITLQPLSAYESPVLSGQVKLHWVLKRLDMSPYQFYAEVYNRFLFPLRRINDCEYFDKEEVYDIIRRRRIIKIPFRRIKPQAEYRNAA